MSASTAIHLTAEERQARARQMRSWANLPSAKGPSATVVPMDHPSRRKPLGLAILDGPEEVAGRDEGDTPGYLEARRLVASAIASMSEAARNMPATIEDVFKELELPLAIQFDDSIAISKSLKELRGEIAALKGSAREEIAALKLALTEARCEVREMRAVQESARIASRGEAGVAGPRGIPGPPGDRGERGEQGPRGEPAAMIVGWRIDADRYTATGICSDVSALPPLNLSAFIDDDDEER